MTTPTLTNVNDAVTPMVAAKPDPPLRQTAGQRKAARKRAAKPEVAEMNLAPVTAELDELVRKDHKSTADRKRLEALQNREAFLLGNPNSAPSVAAIPAETAAATETIVTAPAEPVVAAPAEATVPAEPAVAAPAETLVQAEPTVPASAETTAPAVKPSMAPQPKAVTTPVALSDQAFDAIVGRIHDAAEKVANQKEKGPRELAMKVLNAVLDEFRCCSFFAEREEVIRDYHNSHHHSREQINNYFAAQRELSEIHTRLAQFSLGHSGRTAQILAGNTAQAERVLALGLRKGPEASHSFGAQMGAAVVRLNMGGFEFANKDTVLSDLRKEAATKAGLIGEGNDDPQSAWTALWDFLGASEATGRNELVNLLAAGMMVKKYRAIIVQAEAESPKQAE